MFLLWFENVKFEFCVLDLFVIHYLEVAPTIGEEIIKSNGWRVCEVVSVASDLGGRPVRSGAVYPPVIRPEHSGVSPPSQGIEPSPLFFFTLL